MSLRAMVPMHVHGERSHGSSPDASYGVALVFIGACGIIDVASWPQETHGDTSDEEGDSRQKRRGSRTPRIFQIVTLRRTHVPRLEEAMVFLCQHCTSPSGLVQASACSCFCQRTSFTIVLNRPPLRWEKTFGTGLPRMTSWGQPLSLASAKNSSRKSRIPSGAISRPSPDHPAHHQGVSATARHSSTAETIGEEQAETKIDTSSSDDEGKVHSSYPVAPSRGYHHRAMRPFTGRHIRRHTVDI